MRNMRLSVHSVELTYLRHLFTQRRLELGLSQRALADRLGVVYSFIGKVETGDRRLDIFEFVQYCTGLEWNALEVLQDLMSVCEQQNNHFLLTALPTSQLK
ncbi:XRE family transcriptional regulator [Neisseria animalis]|uniref:XRE family transcriptional regulator n=2 Tax=Neisseria animalis TaxID=492 RepID=A0A5P3MRI7_NEIAN|nr:helix-turn-helix transcriptional regulator [Neisseria animalis]QEY23391.1 XRE family transcriptional regulator [Neisseria animalis]ROW33237.1 XRE family transcriptional regulator [Neisseria animalis]